MTNNRLKGIILVFLATLCWGSAALFIRFFPHLDSLTLVWARYLIASIFLGGISFWQGKQFFQLLRKKKKKWILINSLCMIGTTVFLTMAVKSGTIAAAVFLLYVIPLFVTTFVRMLTEKKQITPWLSVALTFSIIGVFSIFISNLSEQFVWGDVWGILAGLSWGIQLVVGRKLSEDYPGQMGMFLINLVALVLVVPFVNFGSLVVEPNKLLLLIYGLVSSVIAGYAFYAGIKYVSYTDAGIISLFDPIIAAVLAFFLLSEIPPFGVFIGSIFIIVGNLIQMFSKDFTIPEIIGLKKYQEGPFVNRYKFGDDNTYTKQLMAEQTIGFATLFLYYKNITKEIGEKKAGEILKQTSIERRKKWLEIYKKDKGLAKFTPDLKGAAYLLHEYVVEVTPKDTTKEFSLMEEKNNELIYENTIWCPICEAAEMNGLDREKICNIFCASADEWLVQQILPNIKLKQNITSSGLHRTIMKI